MAVISMVEVEQIREQLDRYIALMHTPIYKTVLGICLDRWQYTVNLPGIDPEYGGV
jgi:hypothetical protein